MATTMGMEAIAGYSIRPRCDDTRIGRLDCGTSADERLRMYVPSWS